MHDDKTPGSYHHGSFLLKSENMQSLKCKACNKNPDKRAAALFLFPDRNRVLTSSLLDTSQRINVTLALPKAAVLISPRPLVPNSIKCLTPAAAATSVKHIAHQTSCTHASSGPCDLRIKSEHRRSQVNCALFLVAVIGGSNMVTASASMDSENHTCHIVRVPFRRAIIQNSQSSNLASLSSHTRNPRKTIGNAKQRKGLLHPSVVFQRSTLPPSKSRGKKHSRLT